MSEHYCPRCKKVVLVETERYPEIRFFLCSNCGRRYALEPGKSLSLRLGEAVTLSLHEVYGYASPIEHAERIARSFVSQCSAEKLDWMIKEIRLELDDPTQEVRETVDCRASEKNVRRYLLSFCEHVERLRNP